MNRYYFTPGLKFMFYFFVFNEQINLLFYIKI